MPNADSRAFQRLTDPDARELPPATSAATRERVARYYDRMQSLYSWFWSARGVHYGYWEPSIWSRAAAVRGMDHAAAAALDLPRGARVLDAGCGVGGTSLRLAEEYGLATVGITISPVQLRRARRLAARSRAPIRPAYRLADYLRTGFPGDSFDGAVAIESACYAESKEALLAELFRVLRPGARLVVMDGFLGRRRPSSADLAHLERFMRGFSVTHLASVDEFAAHMSRVGFEAIRCEDKRDAIMPSAVIMEAVARVGMAVVAAPCRLGLLPGLWMKHAHAAASQRRLFRDGVVAYCTFTGRKPR